MEQRIHHNLLRWKIETQHDLERFFYERSDIDKPKRLVNTLYVLTTNLINGLNFKKAVEDSVEFISYRTDIPKEILFPIFTKHLPKINVNHSNQFTVLRDDSYKQIVDHTSYLSKLVLGVKRQDKKLVVSGTTSPETTLTIVYNNDSYNTISISIPTELASNILSIGNIEDTIDLVERYNFIAPETGLFWSIHPRVYKFLNNFNVEKLDEPPIECFASPYNHNLPLFCSAYNEDRLYGSLGNFFNVITSRGFDGCIAQTHQKRRWIVNPPYTPFMFERVINIIENRLTIFPRDEFFFLLPVWKNVKLIETIRSRGVLEIVYAGEYELFDHITGSSLSPPVDLYVGLLKLKTKKRSEMVSRAIDLMRPADAEIIVKSPRNYYKTEAASSYSSSKRIINVK